MCLCVVISSINRCWIWSAVSFYAFIIRSRLFLSSHRLVIDIFHNFLLIMLIKCNEYVCVCYTVGTSDLYTCTCTCTYFN